MDRTRYRKRVLSRLILAPSVLAPVLAGLGGAVMLGAIDPLTGIFAAAAGAVVAGGVLATRWLVKLPEIAAEVYAQMRAEADDAAAERLDAMAARMAEDPDPRNDELLNDLRLLRRALGDELRAVQRVPTSQLEQIALGADRLFESCVRSLDKTVSLWEQAKQMNTRAAQQSTRQARERLLAEVEASVTHLARIVDEVRQLAGGTAGSAADAAALARLRQELDASLEVARRVDERLSAATAESLDPMGARSGILAIPDAALPPPLPVEPLPADRPATQRPKTRDGSRARTRDQEME